MGNDLPICFIDTETTALHYRRRAWEVGVIRREPDGLRKERSWFVHDVDLSDADPESLKFARFYERYPCYGRSGYLETPGCPAGCRTEGYIASTVEELTRGALWVGAVPGFDTFVLDDLQRRHGLLPRHHYQVVDVETLAVGRLTGEISQLLRGDKNADEVDRLTQLCTPPWRSDDLARECGVEPPPDIERHTALEDARWVERWYDMLMGGLV